MRVRDEKERNKSDAQRLVKITVENGNVGFRARTQQNATPRRLKTAGNCPTD